MNNALSKTADKQRKSRLMANPFVCEYQPSVCSCNPINQPFIGRNIPNTGLRLVTRQIHGFTLIELVVTMAVAAILVAIAVPNMRTFIQNGRLNTQVNDLIGDISLARSEAIKRRTNVGICMSTNGITCAGGGDWRDGRAIFVDVDNNDTWNAGDQILRFREGLSSAADTLITNPELLVPVIFSPNGASSVPLGGPVGTFTFCDDRGASKGKQVSLNPMGQVSVSTNPPGAC